MHIILGLAGLAATLVATRNHMPTGFTGFFHPAAFILLLGAPPAILFVGHNLSDVWRGIVMLAQALYFFESNTRSAAILGVVGAGGIGLQIAERIRVRHWDEVAFIILLMIVMVAAIDWLSGRLRRRLIGGY